MNNNGVAVQVLVSLFLAVFVAVGWVMNVIAIAQNDFSDITGVLVLRCIGVVFVPLGTVMGYFF